MMPPRRTGDPELVVLLLGAAAIRDRVRRLLESLLADDRDAQAAVADDALIDALLGLEALARSIELPSPCGGAAPLDEPSSTPIDERFLR